MTESTTAELERLAEMLRGRRERLVSAESCTGGMIAATCTSLAGSSDWFERGFVTYSNQAKSEMLGVSQALVAAHGAVSEAVAVAMANGALAYSAADWSIAVTGIAGPGGAVPGKPVGTVWLALGRRGHMASTRLLQLDGDRTAVRSQTVDAAIAGLCQLIAAAAEQAPNLRRR